MATSGGLVRARVEFDDLAWNADLAGASAAAREVHARTHKGWKPKATDR
jgi:hypothetical protein